MIEISEICQRLNAAARELAPKLLPNGRRAGPRWMFSGVADTGLSESAWVNLSGPLQGRWFDKGNCAAGEDKGDMLDLVQIKECGGDKKRAVEWAKSFLGLADDFVPGKRHQPTREEREAAARAARERAEAQQAELAAERAKNSRQAKRVFLSARDLAGSPAEFYLRGREIRNPDGMSWPGSIRFHPEAWCTPLGRKTTAMVAAVYLADGSQVACHRTYLQADPKKGWTKIDHSNAKMVLGPMDGGFVPVNKGRSGKPMAKMPAGEPVYVTEGIEDALCVRMLLPQARIVCAINLDNLGKILLPPAARKLVLVCDRDENPREQHKLERAIARQQARGLEVDLVLPPPGIKDVNDWIRAAAAA